MTSTIVANGSFLDLSGVISFATIEVQGTTSNTDLVLTADATFENSGTILLDGADSRIYGDNGTAITLDNVNGTIEGAGQIGINNGGLNLTLINAGSAVIDANSTLQLGLFLSASPAVTNAGLLEATNTGGLLIEDGTIDNAGGTVLASGTGDAVMLSAADLVGGTLTTSSGGVIATAAGTPNNTLDGSTTTVTITTGSTVEVTDNSTLFLNGTIANAGTILDATTGDATNIEIVGGSTLTLTGGGIVDMAGGNARIYGNSGTAATLDNVNNRIEGAGDIGINSGGLQLALNNEASGTIDANSTAALVLGLSGSPAASNAGLLEATGTSELAIQDGIVTNFVGTAEGIIAATGTSAVVSLQNAEIVGGTLKSSGGGVIATAAGTPNNTLDGSTTPITITTGSTVELADNSTLFLNGTIDNAGTILNATTGDDTDIEIGGGNTATLTGGGIVDLTGAAARIFGSSSTPGTLDNVNNLIEGAGQIGINNGGLELALVNAAGGKIDANSTAALTIALGGPTLSNAGLIEDTGTGGLVVFSTEIANTGTGTILAKGAGAIVQLSNAVLAGGTLATSGGGVIVTAAGTNNNTLDGSTTTVTITTGSTVELADNSTLFLKGTIDNAGTILNATTGDDTDIEIVGGNTVTLTGGGIVDLVGPAARIFGNSSTIATLDNVNNTIEGAGQIGINNGGLVLALVNAAGGKIDANSTAALTIELGGPTLTNAGLIEDTGTGGLVVFSTEIANTGTGTILAKGAGAIVQLSNAVLAGGTLTSSGSGVIATAAGTTNTLDGSTTPITITTGSTVELADNSTLFLNGTIDNAGTILNATTGDDTDIKITGGNTVTLTGGGIVELAGPAARIFGTSTTPGTLDNANNTIEGAGQIAISNGGLELALINAAGGKIDANAASAMVLGLGGGPAAQNLGLIEATGTSELTIQDGVVTNFVGTAEGIIAATGTSAVVTLQNAGIAGGTLESSGGGVIATAAGTTNTLDGSTKPITITTGSTVELADNSTLFLNGTIANAGTILNATTGDNTDIRIVGGATASLTGGGVVALAGPNARVYGTSSTPATLDNVHNTIEGSGQIGINNGGLALALNNEALGTIDATSTNTLFIEPGGPAVSNRGLMEGTGSGGLRVISAAITNSGTVQALNGSDVTFDTSVTTTNNSGGTLTGGTWAAFSTGGGAHVDITGGAIAVDDAIIILSGAGSTFDAFNGSTYETIEQSLTSIVFGGTLEVLADRNYSTANAITDGGLITLGGGSFSVSSLDIAASGKLDGFGTVTDPLNNGLIVASASGHTLLITSPITGTGELFVDPGATLELGSSVASTETLVVDPGATVKIDDPTGFETGTVATLDPGATFDFGTTLVSATSISAGSLDITLAGGITLDYTLASPDPLDRPAVVANKSGGDDVLIYREAQATITPSGPIAFGIHHVGDTVVSQALTIANTDPADGLSENLDATISHSAGITTSGSISELGAGDTSTALSVDLNTTSAGSISGAATVELFSDGSTIDGNGTLALAPQTIDVTGTVLNFATAAFEELSGGGTLTQSGSHYTLDLGTFAHDGAARTVDLGVLNSAVGPADTLEGSFDLGGSGFGTTGFGTFSGVTAGNSADIGTVTFDPTSIGTFSETITLDPTGYDAAPFSGTLAPETFVIEADVPCFAAGTRVATPDGAVPVEDLRVGNHVLTVAGEARPIVWLGHRRVDCRRHPRPELVWPVRLLAGAFGNGLPRRDLLLSPDHAVFAEGVLIPIKHLINGATIAQVPRDHVTYWHVELPRHAVILAEGLPAESYLDTGNRAVFANGARHMTLHPDFVALSWDDACAPLAVDGPVLLATKRRLLARVAELGYRLAVESDLHLQTVGRVIRPAGVKGQLHRFILPAGCEDVRVVSASGVPAGLDLANADCRRLGARIGAVFLDGAFIALDSPALAAGFHPIERKRAEQWRWTDGDGRLVLPHASPRPALLELLVRDTMPHWQPPAIGRAEAA